MMAAPLRNAGSSSRGRSTAQCEVVVVMSAPLRGAGYS